MASQQHPSADDQQAAQVAGPQADVGPAAHEEFVSLLTAEQLPLHRYITTLLGDADAASNVLQETNIVLWRKMSDFRPGTSFGAWSHKVAYWQTLAYLRDRKRDKHVFSEELVQQIASRPVLEKELDETRIALRHCLAKLSQQHLDLIKQRYNGSEKLESMAGKLGIKQNALKVRLHRIRRALQECILKQTAAS